MHSLSPRPAFSSCHRTPALPAPPPPAAEGLTLVYLDCRSSWMKLSRAAACPCPHFPGRVHESPAFPPVTGLTVPESRATQLCVPGPSHSGSLQHVFQRFPLSLGSFHRAHKHAVLSPFLENSKTSLEPTVISSTTAFPSAHLEQSTY